jgi:beta-N-acetylhexosaminidase
VTEVAVGQLTAEEKAGQLLMLALFDPTAAADPVLAGAHVGSVLLLGTGWSLETAQSAAAQVNALPRPGGLAPFIATDQEGGQVQRLQGAGFSAIPSATTQGTWAPEDLATAAAGWGAELKAAGVNLDLAPVADVVDAAFKYANAPIGQLDREFASDPASAGRSAAAFVTGMAEAGVATAVKHFPGLGRVTGNTDFTSEGIVDDATTTDDPNFEAYTLALAAHPAMVMVALAYYTQIDPDHQAAFSPAVITDLLRGRLGWTGVVISDSLSAQAATVLTAGERAVQFVRAGGDIAIFETAAEVQEAWSALTAEMAADPAFAAQVDAAVARIVTAKQQAGLLG